MSESTIKIKLLQLIKQHTNNDYTFTHQLHINPVTMHYIGLIKHPNNVLTYQSNDVSFKQALFKLVQRLYILKVITEDTYMIAHKIIFEYE